MKDQWFRKGDTVTRDGHTYYVQEWTRAETINKYFERKELEDYYKRNNLDPAIENSRF